MESRLTPQMTKMGKQTEPAPTQRRGYSSDPDFVDNESQKRNRKI